MPAAVSTSVIERQQLLGIPDRKHLQQHRIEHTEDRRVRPDAQRKRQHGHDSEAGIFQQLAEGEFQIIHKPLNASKR